jgi:(R,R)-butanediol dehydrogenase/meso-butanediol dehydrogenase/diacetyl reductase
VAVADHAATLLASHPIGTCGLATCARQARLENDRASLETLVGAEAMRAAVVADPGRPLALVEVEDPVPGPGELLVRVRSAGICGTDLHLTGDPSGVPAGTVLGHEFAGDVVAIGDGVRGWGAGERVCALPLIGCAGCVACLADDPMGCGGARGVGTGGAPGAYAELVRVGAQETFRLPDTLDYEAGALVEPLAVALRALRAATLRPGESVLVLGAGPIGLAAATWARHLGASAVAVADRLPARLAFASGFGASAAIDAAADPGLAGVADACGGPPDVVVECVGSPGMLQECIQHVRRRGRVVVAGACMQPDTVFPAMACLKEVELRFVVAYARADFALAIRTLAAGGIAGPAMVTDRVGLDALPAAFEALRRPTTQCKVMIRP